MLCEFAVTPELFGVPSNKGAEHLPELLGLMADNNGMLADLDKDGWSKHVKERLETLSESSPMLKDRISNCLKTLYDRHRLVRHPKSKSGKPVTDQDWLNLAFESHEKIPFDAIILSKELMENCGRDCDALIDVFNSLKEENLPILRKRTLHLSQQRESEYSFALGPVLRHTRSLFLIDPYMNTTVPFLKTIELCSKLLGKRVQAEKLGCCIHIHALEKNQEPKGREVDFYLGEWKKKLDDLRDKCNHRFQVFLWEKKKIDSESMHDRYILTDQCAISIPGGLDCRGGSTYWNLLDYNVLGRLQRDYDPSMSPFKLKGKRDFQIVESP